jgi:hypothetical protein
MLVVWFALPLAVLAIGLFALTLDDSPAKRG